MNFALRLSAMIITGLFFANCSFAADFFREGNMLKISGPIEPGDYQKLLRSLRVRENMAALMVGVSLNSPGGNVSEAFKIADLIEKLYTTTNVADGNSCASSCIVLYAAGASRLIGRNGRLGVHRVTLDSPDLSVSRTTTPVKAATRNVESYLRDRGIPRKILDKMNETSSSDIYWITMRWLIEEDLYGAISYQPRFIDIASKTCGPDPIALAMRDNTRPTEQLKGKLNEWLACIDTVKDFNQEQHLPEVMRAVSEARK